MLKCTIILYIPVLDTVTQYFTGYTAQCSMLLPCTCPSCYLFCVDTRELPSCDAVLCASSSMEPTLLQQIQMVMTETKSTCNKYINNKINRYCDVHVIFRSVTA